MSILPDGENHENRDEGNRRRRKDVGIAENSGGERECPFAEEIGRGEDEEKAGEYPESEGEKERNRPGDFPKGKEHEEYPPSEGAGSESGKKSGEYVPKARKRPETVGGKIPDGRRLPIGVRPIAEVSGKQKESDGSKPLHGKHVRTRVESFENVLGQKDEDRHVGQVRHGKDEGERES